MFKIRYRSFDEIIYNEIYVNNSYKIKSDISNYIVIDIGCHAGFFIKLTIENGAKFVDAYEMLPDSYSQCVLNTQNYNNVEVSNYVVWRSDLEETKLPVQNDKTYSLINGVHILNTGGNTLLLNNSTKETIDIQTIKFDRIIDKNYNKFGRVDLVKIDCEGSEYPILYTSDKLDLINNMVIEYHYYNKNLNKEAIVNDVLNYNENYLANFLRSKGFFVYIDDHQFLSNDIYHGNMFVFRDENNNPFLIDYLKNGPFY